MPQHDLIVIGAGPGGYVAAIRAAQLGINVGIVEREEHLGGTCLRVGCIPSKAMLESSERYHQTEHELAAHGVKVGAVALDLATMLKRKDAVVAANTAGVEFLMKKNKIAVYRGHARFAAPARIQVESKSAAPIELEATRIIIATGSKSAALPGVSLDGEWIGTSTEALSYSKPPGHLVVIGAGYIGLELGAVWRRLGAKVTVLEFLTRILPGMDAEIAEAARKLFARQGIEFRLGCRVSGARRQKNQCTVEIAGGEAITCDRVLVAVGRVPNTENLGLEQVGVALDARGRIVVDRHWATNLPGVFAIGDVIPGPMLAHKAEDEGVACVEQMLRGHGHVNYDAIPGIVYTNPEIASVGKTTEELQAAGIEHRVGKFQFKANGRARAIGQTDGFAKVLADRRSDRLLGVHIIGPHAGDLIAEAAVAIECGASSEDLARCSHAHPTLSEALKEAALAVDGRAIHGVAIQ
ncbi:MAG: dihydrolipoyl dehydrogenase [Phycisphaerae bacterium]